MTALPGDFSRINPYAFGTWIYYLNVLVSGQYSEEFIQASSLPRSLFPPISVPSTQIIEMLTAKAAVFLVALFFG